MVSGCSVSFCIFQSAAVPQAIMLMGLDGNTNVCEDIGRQLFTGGRKLKPAEIIQRIEDDSRVVSALSIICIDFLESDVWCISYVLYDPHTRPIHDLTSAAVVRRYFAQRIMYGILLLILALPMARDRPASNRRCL